MRLPIILILVLSSSFAWSEAQNKSESSPKLNCFAGPLEKTFGDTKWLVYACDDSRSLAIVSAPGSPAMPFYFISNSYKIIRSMIRE